MALLQVVSIKSVLQLPKLSRLLIHVQLRMATSMALACVSEKYVSQIPSIDDIGQKLYEDYVKDSINGGVFVWTPVKKEKNLMHMSGQLSRFEIRLLSLKKTTKNLYVVLARSSRDIDQVHASNH